MSLQLPANERLTAWGLSLRVSRELARDVLLAEAPAPPPENLEEAVQAYLADRNIRTQSELRRWMQEQQISKADLEAVAMRQLHWLMVCETPDIESLLVRTNPPVRAIVFAGTVASAQSMR